MDFGIPTDIWGNELSDLCKKKLFLFDMDGTIYEEEKLFEGASELLHAIEDTGGRYVFITNNSSKSVMDYIQKVNNLGIKADKDNFFTSSQVSVMYLKENYPNKKVYCQGTQSLLRELINSGINVTENADEDVDVVLVGFDTEMTSDKLNKTCEILSHGVPFIATNPDFKCPVKFGFIPDCGSICSMLTNATGSEPIYLGKPNSIMVDFVREKFGNSIEETIVIGDRLYTDIATGLNAGVSTACVLTGEATKEEILNSGIKPTMTFNSVLDIYKAIVNFDLLKRIRGK